MSVDFNRPRPDVTYLRRRLKPGEQPPAAEIPATSSLTLTPTENEEVRSVSDTTYAAQGTILTRGLPAVRLNLRTSAIGSLAITNTDHVAWQMVDGSTGYLYSTGSQARQSAVIDPKTGTSKPALPEIVPSIFKNRPALEYHKDMLVVSLRQLKRIKRFILASEVGKNIEVATIGGHFSVTLPYDPDTALYVSVVGGEVELRSEKYRNNLHHTFSIGTYTVPSNTLQDFFTGKR